MSTVHFVGGEKGGVGKSVVARLLAQLFIERNLAFAALDADLSHGALMRYYADYSRAVDLTQLDSADQIMDAALASDRRVLVDLPAQSHRFLRRWVDTADVLSYAEMMRRYARVAGLRPRIILPVRPLSPGLPLSRRSPAPADRSAAATGR